MRETADFAKTWQDNPGGSRVIATGPMATNSVAVRSGSDCGRIKVLDSVAVWVNEDAQVGEVIR